ncbi:MAG TPA: Uma2 family endonuclease [Alloacidobacterium sp.]|nr:Uma2 family endonuclease [Alloacidobacterium sp.]
MATLAQVAIETYLKTSYHPDRDYVDGEIEERHLGEFDHAELQTAIAAWFHSHRKEWNIYALTEQRVRISATRVRIPDVCLVSRDLPIEQVITHPPVAVVEILSPEDRVRRYNDRLEDYRTMGVKNIWVLDPATRSGFDWVAGWHEVLRFEVAGTPIFLDVRELFESLQE